MPPSVAASTSSSANTTSVQVAVRIRPTTTHDLSSIPARFQRAIIHASSPTTVAVDNVGSSGAASAAANPSSASSANKKQVFAFDQVHPPEASQYELFNATAAPLITRFVEGFNCTILAYGQTSSGKTHSMTGVDLDADPTDPSNGMGIIPRAVSTIFSRAHEQKRDRGNAWQWSIKTSFIELYNEDLIDLLAVDEVGGRREVQIREEKDGTILWSGLREIPVRSAADVMAILARGTAHRRTNETDMNAQSSRSHAIFSVTLTQKKFSGTGTAPRSGRTSPLPPNGASPSKIMRPGSMYGGSPSRVASPTFGKQLPNSFGAAMARGGASGMLRPSSALGLRERASTLDDEERGEWTTVVSKFHFVDLAGSERLKRTAAAGDRVKEGISINSGLLALGNVISALGDPSRAKALGHSGAIHVPYRDSKLTRLLQDSLGGNAHTLMIACVAPSEWNHGETVNTLKYANRARNIRNRAEIREKEDGWDDLEWLQTMVTKLRKELKVLKEGGATSSAASSDVATADEFSSKATTPTSTVSDRSGGKVLKQYAELQSQYRILRTEYVERNEELARMRKELEEKSAPLSGARRYEEIVGPVIEEYEKTIGAMEAELKLSRTALEHTNEMYNEQEGELAAYKDRTVRADSYIEALRSRLAKLAEREASTESYIRDLEAKLKAYADAANDEDATAELKKEIVKYKESESVSATYIASLEQRLTRADTDIVDLRSQVEKLELDLESKYADIARLQARLDAMFAESEDLRQWKDSLTEREKRVQELERQMDEWEKVRAETGLQRQRLASTVSEVETTRRSLEAEVNGLPASPTHSTVTITPTDASELSQLREKHQHTLAELDAVSAKYRDALKEISDLAAQIQEAKLHSETSSEVSSSEAGTSRPMPRSPKPGRRSVSRRDTSDGLSSLAAPPGSSPHSSRRNFFRHAASSEGLHSRSLSQSLSSEFSSAPFSRTSWANGDSLLSPTSGSFRAIHRQLSQDNTRSPESLEKEIQSLQSVLKDREAEIDALEKRLAETTPGLFPVAPLSGSMSNGALPDVKEENDVASQPETLVEPDLGPGIASQLNSLKHSMLIDEGRQEAERKEAESISRLDELMRSMALKESQHVATVDRLNEELESLRRQHDNLENSSREQVAHMSSQSQAMSGEIESLKAEVVAVEKQRAATYSQLEELKTRESQLVEGMRIAEEKHAREMDELRSAHVSELQKHEAEMTAVVDGLQSELKALHGSIDESARAHNEALVELDRKHAAAIEQLTLEHTSSLTQVMSEHAHAMTRAQEEAAEAWQTAKTEHLETLSKLKTDHDAALRQHAETSEDAIRRLREDHAVELRRMEMAREGTLTESQERQAAILEDLQAEHRSTLDRKESEFKADLRKAQADHGRLQMELEEAHASESAKLLSLITQREADLARVKEEHAQSLAEREKALEAQLGTLRTEHTSALNALTSKMDGEIQRLTSAAEETAASHETALEAANAKLQSSLAKLTEMHHGELDGVRAEHAIALNKLKTAHREALNGVQASLAAAHDEHRRAMSQLRDDHRIQTEGLREEHKNALNESDTLHAQERDTLRKAHHLLEQECTGLKAAVAQLETEAQRTSTAHEAALASKNQAISALQGEILSIKEEHVMFADTIQELQVELERAREAHANIVQEATRRQSVVSELEHSRSILGDTQNELQRTRDDLDNMREENARQDQIIIELRAQLATMKGPRSAHHPPAKPPPLSPPPSIPPPPIPSSVPPVAQLPSADSSLSSASRSLSEEGSEETHSSDHSTSTSVLAPSGQMDPKVHQQIVEQARHLEEQETMIKTLNKQLTHCESDLQAHMDLVATLETSLTDSERNLRKTRMQANEFSKERDRLTAEVDALRIQLQQAQQEITETRRSVVEEKQNYETKLEEERRAKERTRTQLEHRMDEIAKRKSKFVCL